jgi:hypothetical protein
MYEIVLASPTHSSLPANPPVWLRPELMAAVSELHGVEGRHLMVYKGEELLAMLPLYEKRRLGRLGVVSPTGSYYQGLHFFWEQGSTETRRILETQEISSAVAKWLLRHYKSIRINLCTHNTDVRGFTWNGFTAKPLYTFEHKLGEPLKPQRDEREKLKRAEKQGYEFVESLDANTFIDMSKAMYDRKAHSSGLDLPGLKDYIGDLNKAGILKQFNVMKDNQVVSTNLLLCNEGRRAYTILRASEPDEMRQGVSTWHSLKLVETLQGRFPVLDFCGGNVPAVARFKSALGLELKLFFQIHT